MIVRAIAYGKVLNTAYWARIVQGCPVRTTKSDLYYELRGK